MISTKLPKDQYGIALSLLVLDKLPKDNVDDDDVDDDGNDDVDDDVDDENINLLKDLCCGKLSMAF